MSSFHKVFLKISQKLQSNTCATFQASGNFIKKEALGQVFSYEFCEIFKNTFFMEHRHWSFFEYVFI